MNGLIALDEVSVTYKGAGAAALGPLDLDIQPGEMLAVTGPSGSGKSTLLNVLGLVSTPTAGSYSFAGATTAGLSERARADLRSANIGFVFQAFHLSPHRTALENVELAMMYSGRRRRERRSAASDLLGRVGVAGRSHGYPSELSGGERQRVAIARAIANGPSLLLCDEPTGNLDLVSTDVVLGVLDELHQLGVTIVLATHDLHVAAHVQRRLDLATTQPAPAA